MLKRLFAVFSFSLSLSLSLTAQVFVSAKLDGKWGLLDSNGRWHIQPTHDSLGTFLHQTVPYYVNGKWGLLNASGKIVSPPLWQDISCESEGKIGVYDGNYWGFLNVEGKTIITPQFLEADYFCEGLAGASKLEDNWGYIDSSGKWAIAPQYSLVTGFSDGKAEVMEEGKEEEEWYYIDRKGLRLENSGIETNYQREVSSEQTIGIRRKDGSWLIPMEYSNLSLRSGPVYFFMQAGRWGLMDTTLKVLYPAKLEQFHLFSEGLAAVKMDGKWGYINRSGDVVIPFIFEEAGYFSYGRAAVCFGGAWGFIGRNGDFLVPPRFQQINGQYQPMHPTAFITPEAELD